MVVWVCVSCSVQSDFCNPMDCRLPVFSVHGILQTRILGWVPFPSPGELPNPGIGWNWDLLHCRQIFFIIWTTREALFGYHVQLFVTPWTVACQASLSMGFSRQAYWSGCYALLQGIFLIQELNPRLLCLLHCRWIFFSHWDTWEAPESLCSTWN